MSNIVLITPPDKISSQEYSFLLIHPDSRIKDEFQSLIVNVDKPIHVYLYEIDEIDWLLDVFHQVDTVILDIDNSPSKIRDLVSYFITKDKTYWLTNSGENHYNKISRNRIFGLDSLKNTLGDRFGKI